MYFTTIHKLKLISNLIHQQVSNIATYALLVSCLLMVANAQAEPGKSYLRIEKSEISDENDLTFTTIGGLVFEDNIQAHVDLSYLESELNGQGATLDFGGGYVFNGKISLFLGVGISLGYNWDDGDLISTYYPEAGIVMDIDANIGLTVSTRRIFNLYDKDEDIIMLGIVFR